MQIAHVLAVVVLMLPPAARLAPDAHPGLHLGRQVPGDAPTDPTTSDGAFQRWLEGPVRVLLTGEEIELAARMVSPRQQAAFRSWFWARRDASPATARNEFRDEFHARVAVVDQKFGDRRAGHEGWSTTPGVIELLLGPPTEVGRIRNGIVAAGTPRDVILWRYDDGILESGPLEVAFADTPEGFAVISDPVTRDLPVRLTAALDAAVTTAIRRPDLELGEPAVESAVADPLPLRGKVRVTPRAVEGVVALPLSALYGRPDRDGLSITLAIESPPAGSREAAPVDDGGSPGRRVLLRFRLSTRELARWSDRDVRIVFRLPVGATGGGSISGIRVTEVPTGRRGSLEATPGDEVRIPARYAVEHLLWLDEIDGGRGVLAAFVEGWVAEPPAAQGLWLTTTPAPPDSGEVLRSAGGLRLVRAPAVDRRGGAPGPPGTGADDPGPDGPGDRS